jgi:gliding motility-associated protein GldM
MSIPKEPRQLMINLMYLVLTAMLALNVSAEIINAFFALKKGIDGSAKVVDTQNKTVLDATLAAAAKEKKYAEWGPKAQEAQKVVDEFVVYIDGVNKEIFEAAGGVSPLHPDRPVKYKDKDLTTRILVTGGRGKEIEDKITETRNKLLAILPADIKDEFAAKLPLSVDEIVGDDHGVKAKSWAEYKFNHMPVAAVLPTFSKLQSDAKTSGSAILNYCFEQTSGRLEIKLDKYIVAIAPKKAYLISGKDRFEADLVMGAYSSTNNNISISANGSGVPVNQGIGHYTGGVESGTGEKTFTASATIKNPATGESSTVKGEFKYEVGQASCTVAADKMNVFYIGVPNPISISAAGVSSNKMNVSINGGGGTISGSGKSYTVNVNSPGECKIVISSPELGAPASFTFRVKRIPDPVPKMGNGPNAKGGKMGNGEFKAQQGLFADLVGFDFEARCNIQSYTLTRVAKRQDPVPADNQGGTFSGQARSAVDQAKPGDVYYFDDIKARCPGDVAGRNIGSLVFSIK